jgi:hypothetical protein
MIVPGGVYRHYKGKLYRAHALVRHSETEALLVYYETLYDTPLGRQWVRPAEMWNEPVEVEGEMVPRFALVGEGVQ